MISDLLTRLRADLSRSGFSTTVLARELPDDAYAALLRGFPEPARRVLNAAESRDASALLARHFIRVFVVGEALPAHLVERMFPELTLAGAEQLGLLREVESADGPAVRAAISLTPYVARGPGLPDTGEHWWILSDLDDHLRAGPARPDHVMGVGGATRTLLTCMPSREVGTALDLGTGCGIVALHLARIAQRVVATDISERALHFARMNAALNGIDNVDFRRGDLFQPVDGERFDLVLSNPPFVISPEAAEQVTYRSDRGTGDALLERLMRNSAQHLTDGGVLICLANWEARGVSDAHGRVLDWVRDSPSGATVSAWLIERDRQTPLEYALLWARDGGMRSDDPRLDDIVRTWVDDFAVRNVQHIGFGYLALARDAHSIANTEAHRAIRAETRTELPSTNERFGERWERAFAAARAIAPLSDADVLDRRFIAERRVREERRLVPGSEQLVGLALELGGMRVDVDTVTVAAFGACDGELSVREIATALAELLDIDETETLDHLVGQVRELVWLGLLDLKR